MTTSCLRFGALLLLALSGCRSASDPACYASMSELARFERVGDRLDLVEGEEYSFRGLAYIEFEESGLVLGKAKTFEELELLKFSGFCLDIDSACDSVFDKLAYDSRFGELSALVEYREGGTGGELEPNQCFPGTLLVKKVHRLKLVGSCPEMAQIGGR